MNEKFKVEFLPDAVEFMDSLDQKSQQKIYYNIKINCVISSVIALLVRPQGTCTELI